MLLQNFSFFSCVVIMMIYDDHWNTYNERCVIFPYHRENLIYKQSLEDEIRIWLKETSPVKIDYIFKNITCSPIQRELYLTTTIIKCPSIIF